MKNALKVIFLIIVFSGNIFARTRAEVVNDANNYASYRWSVSGSNILDTKTYKYVGNQIIVTTSSPDNIDDRSQESIIDDEVRYSTAGNRSWWPYFIDDNVQGEGYAWGGWKDNPFRQWGADTTTTFESRLSSANRWIAGARKGDTLPNGYYGFTGIDCSGFITRVIGFKGYHYSTGELITYALSISTDNLKVGDILDKAGDHVVLYNGWIEKGRTARIIHSSYKNFSRNEYVYRVNEDSATISGSCVSKTLCAMSDKKYYPYSLFPQFKWISTTDTVRVEIRSGTRISTDSIKLILDYDTTSQIEIGYNELNLEKNTEDNKEIILSYEVGRSSITEGRHSIKIQARNELGLEDEKEGELNFRHNPPTIYWESYGVAGYTQFSRGSVIGDETNNSRYFATGATKFIITSTVSLNVINIYDEEETIVYKKEFNPKDSQRFSYQIFLSNIGIEDGLMYKIEAIDTDDKSSSMIFHLDTKAPEVEINDLEINRELEVKVGFKMYDKTSGLRGDINITPSSSDPFIYNSTYSAYPPNLYEDEYNSGYIKNKSFRANEMDNAGNLASFTFNPVLRNVRFSTLTYHWSEYGANIFKLKKAGLKISDPKPPKDCSFINYPTGMKASVIASPGEINEPSFGYFEYKDDPESPSIIYIPYTSPPSEINHEIELIESTSSGYYYKEVDLFGNNIPDIEVRLVGNTNSGEMNCRIGTETVKSSYKAGEYRYLVEDYWAEGTSLYILGGITRWSDMVMFPGPSFRNFELNISTNMRGDNIWISEIPCYANHLNVKGWKPIENRAYYILNSNGDEGETSGIMHIPPSNLTPKQLAEATIYRADPKDNPWEFTAIKTEREVSGDGSGRFEADINNPSEVLLIVAVPYDDITPPITDLEIYGEISGSNITEDTYIGFEGEDVEGRYGDKSGYANTIYFIDPPEDDIDSCYNIYLTSYNPEAVEGSCNNPIYTEAFNLSIGTHTIYYTGIDYFGNKGEFKTEEFIVSGGGISNKDTIPPETRIEVSGETIPDGSTTSITTGQYITITATDPNPPDEESSGIDKIYYLIDQRIEECTEEPEFNGISGNCNNPLYSEAFKLPVGNHFVIYRSQDKAGNVGEIRTNYFIVVDTGTTLTKPKASINIIPPPPLKTGRFEIRLEITSDTEIIEAPKLYYTLPDGSNIEIRLTGSNKNWSGSSYIETVTPNGTARFNLSVIDAAGNTGTEITAGGSFEIDTTINKAIGGVSSNSDGTIVKIPADAVSQDINIKITKPELSKTIEADNKAIDDKGMKPIKISYEIRAIAETTNNEINNFNKPITISISYPDENDDGIIDGRNIREDGLKMFYLDEWAKKWVLIEDSYVDVNENNVNAETSHLSIYAIMQLSSSGSLWQVFAYPNPCYIKRDGYLRISNIPLSAQDVKIFIYNIAGELVRTLEEGGGIESLVGSKIGKWDGRNENNEKCASGIYIYLIKSSGQKPKTEKVAIFW
jgi:hypothetical protein